MSAEPDMRIRENVPDAPDYNTEPAYASGISEASYNLSYDPPAFGLRIPKGCTRRDDQSAAHPGPWGSDGEGSANPQTQGDGTWDGQVKSVRDLPDDERRYVPDILIQKESTDI
ncbi:uncharacterized protein ARMOST_18192 [Armillaria ostoyae]|uniref:Uncharacterized protein n=1 Tax=Armillaria ostoyae TaxID=47428 RepID=A0A284S149_ARMOS|nr:uncharacterized protein ARMOST_18192 [Armillaria ostoyae]